MTTLTLERPKETASHADAVSQWENEGGPSHPPPKPDGKVVPSDEGPEERSKP
jgi:hypothetical protein